MIQQQQQQQQKKSSSASGHTTSIEGAWVLDLSRSETMESYLQLSGVSAEGIVAHVMAERSHGALNLIQLNVGTFTIHKQTYANNYTETFEIDKEKVTRNSATGTWKSSVVSLFPSGSNGYVQSVRGTVFCGGGEGYTRETRYVMEGGMSHIQEISLRNLATGGECVITRTWRRVSMTHDHRATLALLTVAQTTR